MRRIAIIVDGYSSGRFYPLALKARGYHCVHVQTTPKPLPTLGVIDKSPYEEELIYQGDLAKFTEIITAKYDSRIAAVIAGSEAGVNLADELSERLGLRSNGAKKSFARRDKYAMVEALRAHGIKTVEHFKSAQLGEIIEWVKRHGKWPVVLKPLSSAGTDGVYICNNMKEVNDAYRAITGKRDIFERENAEVLVQSYLDGQEYVVNSINCVHPVTGQKYHFVNDMWLCKKQEFYGHRIYDYELSLPFNEETQVQLVSYVNQVLEALGINYGPSHAEVMMTKEGPVLVEVASRFSGGTNPDMSLLCLGYNPIDFAVLSFTDPTEFFRSILPYDQSSSEIKGMVNNPAAILEQLSKRKPAKNYAAVMDLAVNLEGEVQEIPFKKALEDAQKAGEIKSVFLVKYKISIGQKVTRTVSLLTSPIQFHLVHPDLALIKKECEEIKRIAAHGIVVKPLIKQSVSTASMLINNGIITQSTKPDSAVKEATSAEALPVKITSKL